MRSEDLFRAIGAAGDEALSHSERRSRRPLRTALAACLCLAVLGLTALLLPRSAGTPVPHWSEEFDPEDYFTYAGQDSGDSPDASGCIADSAIPYDESRSFSDLREQLEAEGVIPVIDTHRQFYCMAHYNDDGSLYSLEITWHRRDDHYSDLQITVGYEEVPEITDCILVETDERGNILEPAVTVTQRDGIDIIAKGRKNQNKTLTFQTEAGWYQLEASWNDSYDDLVFLLDWVWEHPIDLSRFPLEAGDHYTFATLEEMPDAFADCLPDFSVLPALTEAFTLGEHYVQLKNGVPCAFEGHYAMTIDGHIQEDAIHWCIDTEPDAYDLTRSLGRLEDLTEQDIIACLEEERSFTFQWNGICFRVFTDMAEEAWLLAKALLTSSP